jgi:hypothetical protein
MAPRARTRLRGAAATRRHLPRHEFPVARSGGARYRYFVSSNLFWRVNCSRYSTPS